MKNLLYRRNYDNIEAMGLKMISPPNSHSTGYYYPIALEMLDALEKAGVLEPVERDDEAARTEVKLLTERWVGGSHAVTTAILDAAYKPKGDRDVFPCEFGYTEEEHLRDGVYVGCPDRLQPNGGTDDA